MIEFDEQTISLLSRIDVKDTKSQKYSYNWVINVIIITDVPTIRVDFNQLKYETCKHIYDCISDISIREKIKGLIINAADYISEDLTIIREIRLIRINEDMIKCVFRIINMMPSVDIDKCLTIKLDNILIQQEAFKKDRAQNDKWWIGRMLYDIVYWPISYVLD